MKALAIFFTLFMGIFVGIMFEYYVPSHRGQYERRLRAECVKCGSSNITFRHCEDSCKTPCPTLDERKRGAMVVWGHEHLHRACMGCGYAKDAMECQDKEQP